MTERTTAILANFVALRETTPELKLDRSRIKAVPEGMSWIMRDGKQTTCVKDSFSAIHGYNGPCNCGLMGRAHRGSAH